MHFLSEMHFFPSGFIPESLIQNHFTDVTDAKHHLPNAKVDDSIHLKCFNFDNGSLSVG